MSAAVGVCTCVCACVCACVCVCVRVFVGNICSCSTHALHQEVSTIFEAQKDKVSGGPN